ncbi:MAG: hypothetical protein CML46_16635 [Rhodobacteraceae bacterium]|nr:hypothetical protein [Paracoccaceae bacterium]MBR28545.1 hypothetical protein [Paracoccaceae bacterium]
MRSPTSLRAGHALGGRLPALAMGLAAGLAWASLAAVSAAAQTSPPSPDPSAGSSPRICLPGEPACLDPEALIRLVHDIAFGREDFRLPGDARHFSDQRLRRFPRGLVPVEVYSDDGAIADDPKFWEPFRILAQRLPGITGLRLAPRAQVELWEAPPGVMVFVGTRGYLRESLATLARISGTDPARAEARFDALAEPFLRRGRPVCFAEIRFRSALSAEVAFSVVALESSPALSECVYEEMLQALGPINDSRRMRETLFNDAARVGAPTAYDWLAFAVIYDPRLVTGMTEAEAAPIIARIVEGYVSRP